MTDTRHHPSEATLMAFAAGALDEGLALVVSCHLVSCPACRALVAEGEMIGGALLDSSQPAPLADDALSRMMARLDEPEPPPPPATDGNAPAWMPAPLARQMNALHGPSWAAQARRSLGWRWLAPGVRQLSVMRRTRGGGTARLLSIAPGTTLPHHDHGGLELTCVLDGAFHDERALYQTGDVAELEPDTPHQPVAEGNHPCLCLIANEQPTRFSGLVGRLTQPLIGF
ncbi:ChrR family anti-sigma-E factor [Roseospirillum parvum]|uniref:Putative transcriptional regulator n=1 Tax=Roseospirillum parvum TaxID=83401 RepID=A0A1G7XY60_9PROT|nr:ChrR family anti-sigma-E factor [Roseospirillum parvum]SDG89145.1 putative transcriptional regulator [Roseospirillum parvum]